MRIDVAALKACTGIVALCWATIATSAGTDAAATSHRVGVTASGLPSIILLPTQPGLAGTCGGSAFVVNTFIDVTAQASAEVTVSAPGVGTIEQFTDETGRNVGPYNDYFPTFQILAFGGGLAPNTLITISIITYAGPHLSGSITFFSTLTFDCTTGRVVGAQAPLAPAADVPALTPLGLAATAVLLLLMGAVTLRGRRQLRDRS